MIEENKQNVIKALKKYFNATDMEIEKFEKTSIKEPMDWTCGFSDEIVPNFLALREQII
jgi:hypothetical protein